jgi:hypothetical protein
MIGGRLRDAALAENIAAKARGAACMGVFGLRSVSSLTIVFGGLVTLAAAGIAQPQTPPRPPIGGSVLRPTP